MFKLPDGSLRLIVQGLSRLQLESITVARPYLRARVNPADDTRRDEDRLEIDALQRNIKTNFQHVVSLSPLLSDDLQALAMNITEPGRLADFIASSLATLSTAVKQEVLETVDVRSRLDLLNRLLIKEAEVLELGSKIQSQVQSEVGKNQREYFLREQMKAIQKELGEGDDQTKEVEELREKIEAVGMPELVKKEAKRELDRLSRMPAPPPVHGLAHLPRLAGCASLGEAHRRSDRSRQDQGGARQGSLGPREGEGPHPRVPRRPEAESGSEGTDPLFRRPSWSRQDVARAIHR
jgi:ATP-dependent Lon protease